MEAPAQIAQLDAARDRRDLVAALARVAEGEPAALGDVYDRTHAKLFGICLRILGDRSDAEEVLQEVYLTVWRGAARFAPERASPITWLATLARNRAIDRLRSGAKPRAAVPLSEAAAVADTAAGAFDQLEASEECTRLMRCLDALDQRQSAAIRNAFFDGQSYAGQAERAGVPQGTMKSWVRRGLARLRECLDT